jgi:hypothetical protein
VAFESNSEIHVSELPFFGLIFPDPCGHRVPQDCPLEAAQLIAECLSLVPENRPSAKDIVVRLRAMTDDCGCSLASSPTVSTQRSLLSSLTSSVGAEGALTLDAPVSQVG